MSGSFVSPAGECVAVIRIDGLTDAVLSAYGARLSAVVIPTSEWEIELSPSVGSAPELGAATINAQAYTDTGANFRQFAYRAPGGPNSRVFGVAMVDAAGAPAVSLGGPITIMVFRAVIPGAQ